MGLHTYRIKSNIIILLSFFKKWKSISQEDFESEITKATNSFYEIVNELGSIFGENFYYDN